VSAAPVSESLARLPKAELHVHLDGSLRPSTMMDLADERRVDLPADTPEALAAHMLAPRGGDLVAYLERFETTVALMQDADALERITYELVVDHATENVRWVEVRFCPALCTREGLRADEVLDAASAGLRRAEAEYAVRGALIVCALRSEPAAASLEMAELAVAYAGRGVCGFDLAGAEAGHPVLRHAEAFDRAAEAGLPITIHAGEAYGPDSIRQAIERGHASRIGHGTRLGQDPELLDEIRRRGIPLEVCLTSNVQTGVVARVADHPARDYLRRGVAVCVSTDNRLMSGVTLTGEYEHARDALGLTWRELVRVARAGFEHAFATEELKTDLLAAFDREVEGRGGTELGRPTGG
jgi:adenosine deaminase